MKRSLMIAVCVLACVEVQAAKAPKLLFDYKPMTASPEEVAVPSFSQEEFKSLFEKEGKVSSRKPSNITDDSSMSKELKSFRDRLNALGRDEEGKKISVQDLAKMAVEIEKLDRLLNELANVPADAPVDYKILAAQVAPMRHFKSFVYRMTDVLAPARFLRQSVVDVIQDVYSDLKIYMPSNEWEVGFAYLTQPVQGTQPKFRNEAEVQEFLGTLVYRDIATALNMLYKVSIPAGKPLVWDNRIFFGKLSFPQEVSPSDRFVTFHQGELNALMAVLHRQAYLISVGSIYNNQGLVKLVSEMSELYGMKAAGNTIAPSLINLMAPSRSERVSLMTDGTFKNSFTKNPQAAQWSERAIAHLQGFIGYGFRAWKEVSGAPDDDLAILVPGLNRGRPEQTRKMFQELGRQVVAKEPVTVYSVITNKPVKVDFVGFLRNLPQDSKSLLPTEFENNRQEMLQTTVAGKELKFRNFRRGRAIGWDATQYERLFPDLAQIKDPKKKSEALQESMRTWSESRGGLLLAEFVRPFVK